MPFYNSLQSIGPSGFPAPTTGKEEMKKRVDEQIVQSFSHRCPYCDQPLSYDHITLRDGENSITCPSCNKIFIKVVSGLLEEGETE
jgi:hypothetical protein